MTKLAEEAARLIDSLPTEQAHAIIEYARYLAEKTDQEAWERRLDDPKYAARLRAMMGEVDREIEAGAGEPLDPERM